jgi:hypothetical protein
MLANTKSAYLKCTDFDTVLLAPQFFQKANRSNCDLFGCFIAHEQIANFVPDFRAS